MNNDKDYQNLVNLIQAKGLNSINLEMNALSSITLSAITTQIHLDNNHFPHMLLVLIFYGENDAAINVESMDWSDEDIYFFNTDYTPNYHIAQIFTIVI